MNTTGTRNTATALTTAVAVAAALTVMSASAPTAASADRPDPVSGPDTQCVGSTDAATVGTADTVDVGADIGRIKAQMARDYVDHALELQQPAARLNLNPQETCTSSTPRHSAPGKPRWRQAS